MKVMLVYLLAAFFTFQQDKVLICEGSDAYAYHNRQCQGLNRCTHKIEYVSMKEALSLKRKACGYCYGSPGTILPLKSPSSGQCAATTKKGTQCSRKATSGGYCWQHK